MPKRRVANVMGEASGRHDRPDIDIIIAYGNETLLTALQADALIGTIPAVKNGAVAIIEDGTPLAASGTPSALSIRATIDEYLEIIGAAANQVK